MLWKTCRCTLRTTWPVFFSNQCRFSGSVALPSWTRIAGQVFRLDLAALFSGHRSQQVLAGGEDLTASSRTRPRRFAAKPIRRE
jgi:hypothetical protein